MLYKHVHSTYMYMYGYNVIVCGENGLSILNLHGRIIVYMCVWLYIYIYTNVYKMVYFKTRSTIRAHLPHGVGKHVGHIEFDGV